MGPKKRATGINIWNQSVVPCPVLLLPDLYIGFSRGRSGGLVFPEGTTGPLPSAEGTGHLAEGSSLQFTGFCILPAPGQESAYGWGTRNSLISTRHRTSFNTRGFRGDSARPLGCKAMERPRVPTCEMLSHEDSAFSCLWSWGCGLSGWWGYQRVSRP